MTFDYPTNRHHVFRGYVQLRNGSLETALIWYATDDERWEGIAKAKDDAIGFWWLYDCDEAIMFPSLVSIGFHSRGDVKGLLQNDS